MHLFRINCLRLLSLPLLVISITAYRLLGGTVYAASVTHTTTQHSSQITTCGKWSYVPSPSPVNPGSTFNSVATIATNDAWAVGYTYLSNRNKRSQTLTEQWNGSKWIVVHSPNPGDASLSGVAADSANNVWAVGSFLNLTTRYTQTLIEHWNGTQWSVVSSPDVSVVDSLSSVAIVSANDVWAVGSSNGGYDTLIEHWNGIKWSVITSPNESDTNELYSIAAVSANDIWAVGDTNGLSTGDIPQALSEHWNGTNWSVVQNPTLGKYANGLSRLYPLTGQKREGRVLFSRTSLQERTKDEQSAETNYIHFETI